MSTLLPGTPFFIQVFHHTPFILAHTLLPVLLCVRCSKKGNSLCAINSLLLSILKQIIITSFHATYGTVLSPSRVAFICIFWFHCLSPLTVRIQTDSPCYFTYYIARVILMAVLSSHVNILIIRLYTFLCTLIIRESQKKTDANLKILMSLLYNNSVNIYLYFTTNYHCSHVNIYNNYIIKHSVLVIPILKTNTIDVSVFTAEYHITHVYYTTKICLSIYKVNFHGKCRLILMFLMDYYLCLLVLLIHTFNSPIMVIHLVITPYSGKLLTVYNLNLLINYQLLYCFQYIVGIYNFPCNMISVLRSGHLCGEKRLMWGGEMFHFIIDPP